MAIRVAKAACKSHVETTRVGITNLCGEDYALNYFMMDGFLVCSKGGYEDYCQAMGLSVVEAMNQIED